MKILQYPSKTFEASEIKDVSKQYLIWGSDHTRPAFLGFDSAEEAYVYIDLYCSSSGWYHPDASLSDGDLDPRPSNKKGGVLIFHYLRGNWNGFVPPPGVVSFYEKHIQEFPYSVQSFWRTRPTNFFWYAKNYEEAEIVSRDISKPISYSKIIDRSKDEVVKVNKYETIYFEGNVWVDKRSEIWRKEYEALADKVGQIRKNSGV